MKRQPSLYYFGYQPSAFLRDVRYMAFSASQRGVFHHMLVLLYSNEGRIKYDEKALRTVCNAESMPPEEWDSVVQRFVIENEMLTHPRVSKEIADARMRREMARRAGRASWSKRKQAERFDENEHELNGGIPKDIRAVKRDKKQEESPCLSSCSHEGEGQTPPTGLSEREPDASVPADCPPPPDPDDDITAAAAAEAIA